MTPVIGVTATLKEDVDQVAERPLGHFVRADLDYVAGAAEAGGGPRAAPRAGRRGRRGVGCGGGGGWRGPGGVAAGGRAADGGGRDRGPRRASSERRQRPRPLLLRRRAAARTWTHHPRAGRLRGSAARGGAGAGDTRVRHLPGPAGAQRRSRRNAL